MAVKITNPIRVAILGILALVAFVLGFNFLKSTDTFGKEQSFTTIMDEARGLTPSSFVLYKGVNVGSVKKINLSQKFPGKVEIVFTVHEGIQIPTASQVFVTSQDLLTGKVLGIQPSDATTFYDKGAIIPSFLEKSAIDNMSKMAANADTLTMKKLDQAVVSANTMLGSVDATVNNVNSIMDAQLKQNLKNSIAGLNKVINDFNKLSTALAAQQNKIAGTMQNIETFTGNLNKNNTSINASIANLKSTTDNLKDADLAGTINGVKITLNELNTTLNKVNSTNGSLGLLMNDKKLYNDLDGSIISLNNLLVDFKANPKKYVHFSVFGKKDKSATTNNNSIQN